MNKIILISIVVAPFFLFTWACGSSKKMISTKVLTSQTWELSTLQDEPLNLSDFQTGKPFLKFEDDGKLSGSTGCNNFTGSYKLADDALTLDPGAMTRMACPGNGETIFLNALKEVKMVKTGGDKLILLDGTNEIMTLVTKK